VTKLVLDNGPASAAAAAIEPDAFDQLKKLADLKEAGVVTPEEFEAKKSSCSVSKPREMHAQVYAGPALQIARTMGDVNAVKKAEWGGA
jgi:Short C-terminal domain